jgi:hypothetical protein
MAFAVDSLRAPPPSREANPFATCWTRPGAIAYQFPDGQSATQLVARLAAQQWRGAIIGPHGSGKSTLLETLKPELRTGGFHVQFITLRGRERRLPGHFFDELPERRSIAVIDGYEQLGWLDRSRLDRCCRRRGIGLLVTAHCETNIATLIRLMPDRKLVQNLVAALTTQSSTPITPADVAASHAIHGGNVREVFFDLYDRHETRRRNRE